MALEDLLRENTDAINRLTAVTENLMNLRTEAIDAVKDAGKTGKPAAKKPSGKGNISDSPEDRKDPADAKPKADPKPKETSGDSDYETMASAIQKYVGFDDDKDRRGERAANVKKIFGHDKIKAANAKEVPEKMIKAVIANIKKLHDKAVEEAADSGSGGDDDLLG